jgi:hypothetical protein
VKKPNLEAIEKRARRAMKGPWVVWKGTSSVEMGPATLNEIGEFRGPVGGGGTVCEVDDFENRKAKVTARFIAHARTDVPALCAAVRERDATITRLRAALTQLGERFRDEDTVAEVIIRNALEAAQ